MTETRIFKRVSLLLVGLLMTHSLAAAPLTQANKHDIVKELIDTFSAYYVFPEVAQKIKADVEQKITENAFDDITTHAQLAHELHKLFRAGTSDKHVRLVHRTTPREQRVKRPPPAREFRLLEEGIGYLKFNQFRDEPTMESFIDDAFDLFQDSSGIIIDMRENGGGSPYIVAYLASYFFNEPTVLNRFYDRQNRNVDIVETFDDMPSPRVKSEVPLYILTSDYTFSAAEGFSYHMQAFERAKIVGEVTGGGAHPVRSFDFEDGYQLVVPYMRAENAKTKTNWEQVGVIPDHKVDSESALEKALELVKMSRIQR